jgi:hypothetical protein
MMNLYSLVKKYHLLIVLQAPKPLKGALTASLKD